MMERCRFGWQLDVSQSMQVGVFPEQGENWEWIARQVARARPQADGGYPLRVLNLFAYTGGSTLAAAAAGAEVVHVDAMRNVVERARQNAAISGLGERPIRWIAEDVMKFCRREVKRGNRYDAVILDPPTYGHGPKGTLWQIDEFLLPLLELCGELTADARGESGVRAGDVPFAGHRTGGAVGVFIGGNLWTLRAAAEGGGVVFGGGRWPSVAERCLCSVAGVVSPRSMTGG